MWFRHDRPHLANASAMAGFGLIIALTPLVLAGCDRGGSMADKADSGDAVTATLSTSATLSAGAAASDSAGARPTMQLVRVTPRPSPTPDPSQPLLAHSLVVDAEDPAMLFLTFVRGIMHSTDGGLTWGPLNKSKVADGTALVAAAQVAGGRLFAGGPGTLRTSTDRGKTWAVLTPTLGVDIRGLVTDPTDGRRLYALVRGKGVGWTTDDGKTWTASGGQLPPMAFGLWVMGANPTVLVTTDRGDGGLLKSGDGGASWQPMTTSGATGEWLMITRAGDRRLMAATTDGLFRSDDGGGTWTKFGPFKVVVTMAVAPGDPQTVFAITPDGYKVYRSLDGGATWPGSGTPSATPFPAGDATPLPTRGPGDDVPTATTPAQP